jgi:hypothetical protein
VSSRPGGTGRRATRKPIVVVAGESANDREVLRFFLEEFCPEMQGRIVFLNDKVPCKSGSNRSYEAFMSGVAGRCLQLTEGATK